MFDRHKMNMFVFDRCLTNDVQVPSMFDPLPKSKINYLRNEKLQSLGRPGNFKFELKYETMKVEL